jgi:hypothetical protein
MTTIVDENRAKLQVELHSKRGALSSVKHEIRGRGLGLLERKVSDTVKKVNEERIAELDFQKEELEEKITELNTQLKDPKKEKLTIEQFLNLSKNAGVIVQSADAVVKDIICRQIFLNFTIDEEKVLSYQLKEPFATLLKHRKILTSRGGGNNLEPLFKSILTHWKIIHFKKSTINLKIPTHKKVEAGMDFHTYTNRSEEA